MSLSKVTTLRHFFSESSWDHRKVEIMEGAVRKVIHFSHARKRCQQAGEWKKVCKSVFLEQKQTRHQHREWAFFECFQTTNSCSKNWYGSIHPKKSFFKIDNAPYILKKLKNEIDISWYIMKFLKIVDECIEDWAIDCAHSRTISPSTC